MKNLQIRQIGIVVGDAAKTAKNYTAIFGVGPWNFRDVNPTNVLLNGKALGSAEICIREASAPLTGMEIKLLQPLYGESVHADFLRKHGGGICCLSFGEINDYDDVISAFENAGLGIEMQGKLEGGCEFSYINAVRELGAIFEVMKPSKGSDPGAQEPWGIYAPSASALWNMEKKRINQIGYVVDDAEGMAKRYEDILGTGPWRIVTTNTKRPVKEGQPKRTGPSKAVLHGIPWMEMDLRLKIALADFGGMQLELIQPLAGPGTHWEFLKMHGNGVHHLSFGRVEDYEHCVEVFQQRDIEIEMAGPGSPGSRFFYMATQKELGTIYEFVSMPSGTSL